MKCPKCGEKLLKVHGSFAGHQVIDFDGEDGLEVTESDPTDFDWDDHDTVECLGCRHEGPAVEFTAKEAKVDEG